jgi:superfamily II DNA or RNA helicase
MAIVANYHLAESSLLIVVPSELLTDQICEFLNSRHWVTIGGRPPRGAKPAVSFVPSTLGDLLNEQVEPTVFVCTTQTLAMMHPDEDQPTTGEWSHLYQPLGQRVAAVMVDEGHREPALTWARAVRGFGHPVILFSATPYRNDLRMFKIGRGRDFRFALRFPEAVKRHLIRDVAFRYPSQSFVRADGRTTKRDPQIFANQLLDYYYGSFRRERPVGVREARVIIRCDTEATVRSVHKAIRDVGRRRYGVSWTDEHKAIGIHENFHSDKDRDLLDRVPREGSATRALFWVHQFKLTEGLDNPDFCLVAFFEPFQNSRSLVQQIGRLLRNPGGRPGQAAIVFSDGRDHLKNQWDGYVAFESCDQDVIGAEDIVHAVREAQPKWYYASGAYRCGANFESTDLVDDVRVPTSARMYVRPEGFGVEHLRRLAQEAADRMEEHDMVQVKLLHRDYGRDAHSVSVVFWEVMQTESLATGGFFNIRLFISLLYMNRNHIFHQARFTTLAEDDSRVRLVEIGHLEALVPTGPGTLKQLSLVNCDIGDTAIRRRALGGRSLDQSAKALSDHLHFISSLVCREGGSARYLGFRRSTITERSARGTLEDFANWADGISEALLRGRSRNPMLRRYAKPVRAPREANARHLLLDLAHLREEFVPSPDDDLVFSEEFLATACDVAEDGSFTCEIENKTFAGAIHYSNGRFRIVSEPLNKALVARTGRAKADSFLSTPTIMRVVTEDGLIYADGRFYDTSRLHGPDRVHDLDIVVSIPYQFAIDHKEKGEKGILGRDSWQRGSLFHEIDRNSELFKRGKLSPHILVCDDLGTEIADFIAVDVKQRKIALLHAKVFENDTHLSAKAMQDVVAQAKKNLAFLDPAEMVNRGAIGAKWDSKWRWSKGSPVGLTRIRRDDESIGDGARLLETIQTLLRSASVQKEVWLVLGRAFTKDDLRRIVLAEEKIPYHWVQLLYLIHSCQASVEALGASLRIVTLERPK